MTTAKRFAFAIAVILFALAFHLQAQTPPTGGSAERESAESAAGRVHLEVFSPSGEMVFETNGPSFNWSGLDSKGERVPDGVYLARVIYTDAAGKRRTRVEQIVVNSETRKGTLTAGETPEPTAIGTIMGEGTAGKLAKFTAAHQIANSIVTESAGKVGIATTAAPNSVLQINGAQPAPVATNGTNAPSLLRTSGGKGGDTTASGKKGGVGANIVLLAGFGGDAVAGSMNGDGGSILLQPGFGGTGGNAGGGKEGKVQIAPFGGNVGIGTLLPESKLTVIGSSTGDTLLRVENSSTGSAGAAIFGKSTGGSGVFGYSTSGDGVVGVSTSGYAGSFGGKVIIRGNATIPEDALLFGSSTRQMVNLFSNTYGIGVQSATQYFRTNGGFAWFKGGVHNNSANSPGSGGTRLMRLDSSGNLYTLGTVNPPSDRNLKADFSAVNPRSVLDKLVSIPIQSWHYRSEPETVRHLGPVAQDFRAAFNLGADDKHISTVDADGVTMAAIQGLYQMMMEKDRQIEALTRQVEQQQAQLNRVSRTLRRRRGARR